MYKRILAWLMTGSLLLGSFASMDVLASDKALNVQALPVMEDNSNAESPYSILENDELVAENENLALYLQESALIVKIKNKKTGYIWSSAVPFDMTMGMSTEWQRMSQSLLTMDYISGGTIKRSPLKHGETKPPKITKTKKGFEAVVEFYEAKAVLKICFELTDDSLKVSIPDESIEIEEGNLVNKIYLMPFLGATYQNNIPGYLFVPDGTGALMRFQESRPFRTLYQQKVYGEDEAVSKTAEAGVTGLVAKAQRIHVPVFGAVHGNRQNGFVGIVNNGDEYCEISASPAGNIVDYHWIAPAFLYNEQYWQPTGKSEGFYGNQTKANEVNLEVEYQFLSGEQADYVGMANAYKEKLLSQNSALSQNEANADIGLKLDAFMGEPKKALIGRNLKVMTTVEDVTDWVLELQKMAIGDLQVSLVGFEKMGKNGHKFGTYSMDKGIGSSKETKDLSKILGGNLYLQSDFNSGYDNQFAKSQLRSGMNGAVLGVTEKQPIFQNRVWASDQARENAVKNYLKNAPTGSLAMEGIAVSLFGDYQRKTSVSRSQALENTKELLAQAIEKTDKLSLESPNFYAFETGDVESIFNTPMSNTQYSYFSDTVPFLQIVLSGYVDCYSEYQNFTTNTVLDVLKLIDYNTFPSYILTQQPSTELANSNMSSIFSSQFDTWKPYIYEHYTMVNEVLSKVTGAQIIARRMPEDGVSVTEYDNGICIAVNYNENEAKVEGNKIPAMSALSFTKGGAE